MMEVPIVIRFGQREYWANVGVPFRALDGGKGPDFPDKIRFQAVNNPLQTQLCQERGKLGICCIRQL